MNEIVRKNVVSLAVLVVLCFGFVVAGNVYVTDGDLDVDDNLNIGNATLNYSSSGGVEKNYLSLDGDGDYVDAGNDPSLSMSDDITLIGWIKRDITGEIHNIFAKRNSNASQLNYQLNILASNELRFAGNDGAVYTIDSIGTITDTNWHHVAFTWDTGTDAYNFYIDGADAGNGSDANDLVGYSNNLRIGNDHSVTFFNGTIDEVMIFNRTLNSTEVADLDSSGRNLGSYSDANLVSHWRFDDGTADDDKGLNDGTLQGNANVESSTAGTPVLNVDSDLDVLGDITADSYSDHTPAWVDGENEALEAVLDIRSKDGNIDHDSLPEIARSETGRSLGGMISVLVEAVKGVFSKVEDLEKENELLKTELCERDLNYSWC